MTDLERAPSRELTVPITGQLVNLDDPDQVADALETVRDAKHLLDDARSYLEQELVAHAREQGTKTLHLKTGDAVITGGTTTEWDTERLADGLRHAGLPEHRIAEVIVQVVSYKVNALEAKRVAAANPAYAQVVDASKTVVPAAWRVTVKWRGKL